DILWELELRTRTKFMVATPRPPGMSIEHALPQNWTKHWPLPNGQSAPADLVTGADNEMLSAIAARQAALHTLGNLTLVTVPANAAASNGPFEQKRGWLQQSLLALNLEIIDYECWDEAKIQTRASLLAERAVEIWPGIE